MVGRDGVDTVDVPLVVSGGGKESGGRLVTIVDPPLEMVTGIDGSNEVTGSEVDESCEVDNDCDDMDTEPLVVEVPLLVSGVGNESGGREVTTTDPPLVIVTETDGAWVVIGAGPLDPEVLWVAEFEPPEVSDDRLKVVGSRGLLGLRVGTAMLVVTVPRVSERVTGIDSGGRLKLD